MRLVFWGGPLDGRILDVQRLGPVIMPVPVIEQWSIESCYPHSVVADMKTMTYWPRKLDAPVMQPLGQRGWWVMVPADASDDELRFLLARHSPPLVDGGHGPYSWTGTDAAYSWDDAYDSTGGDDW